MPLNYRRRARAPPPQPRRGRAGPPRRRALAHEAETDLPEREREADAAAGAFILTLAKAVRLGPLEGGRMIANLKSGAAISAAGLQALNGHIDVGPYHLAQNGVRRCVTRCAHGAEQFVLRHGELC